MVDKNAPDMELLYYMSEKDGAEDIAREAFQIFLNRHHANLVVSCRKSLSARTHGRPFQGESLDDAANDLANSVMQDVYQNLCAKFTKEPAPGTETKAVQVWLARIAYYHVLRAWTTAIKEAMQTVHLDMEGFEAHEEENPASPITDFINNHSQDAALETDQDESPEKARLRSILVEAWGSLSEQDQQVLKCSAEHNAGWALNGHATHKQSRQLAKLFNTNPVALRKRRQRALDRLKLAVERIIQPEHGHEDESESRKSSANVTRFERRRT